MKPALGSGALNGKILCPNKKCNQNIGKFAWQGLRCSCGGWITPGFGVARGKVDEIKVDLDNSGGAGRAAGGGEGGETAGRTGGGATREEALRLPPSMKKGGNL